MRVQNKNKAFAYRVPIGDYNYLQCTYNEYGPEIVKKYKYKCYLFIKAPYLKISRIRYFLLLQFQPCLEVSIIISISNTYLKK